MNYSTLSKRGQRFFRKRGVREALAQVPDPRQAQGRRWPLGQVVETVLGGLRLQIGSWHRLDERTRPGPPLRVGELPWAPLPDATLPWLLPQWPTEEVRQGVVQRVRAEGRRTSVVGPPGAMGTRAIDSTCLWSGRRGGGPDGQPQGGVRGHRVMRALLTSARPRRLLDQRALAAEEHEMGACAAFWAQRLDTYGRLRLVAVVTRDAGYASLSHATLVEAAGYRSGLGLKEHQPGLLPEAPRLLVPLAATRRPEAKGLEREHHHWVRRRRWRTEECAGWLDWQHRRQVWLVRTETCARQTTPRADRVPVAVADHDSLPTLPWQRLEGVAILGVSRGHWGIENQSVRTLDLEWREE